jgi:hypothetical protein
MRTRKLLLALGCASSLCALTETPAHAESIINNPGDHPDYKFELEPHGLLGWGHLYAGNGFGVGIRGSIPIVDNGFVKTINNSVAISFGLDWLRYSGCYYRGYRGRNGSFADYGCGASYFIFPVAMQWNFWLTTRWSVFGEPGLYIYHGVYNDFCDPNVFGPGCDPPTHTGVDFAFYAGGRFHFNEKVALTMRVGYPTLSVGVSFLF